MTGEGDGDGSVSSEMTPDQFQRIGMEVIERLAEHLRAARAREMPVLDVEEAKRQAPLWREPFSMEPCADPADEMLRMISSVLETSNHLHHPGYIGHQVSVPLPFASLLELTNAFLNNGMAVFEMGPLQTVMEIQVVEFLCQQIGYGNESGGALTHGGSLGNLTALLAMRQSGQSRWGDSELSVLVSDSSHYSIDRATRILGWGSSGSWKVRADRFGQIDVDRLGPELEAARTAGRRVIGVVANCCCTVTGRFDPLRELVEFCRENELWLHVDGAHGASLAFSETHRGLLDGIEHADSVVWDLHKLAGLPALNTAVLFKNRQHSLGAFAEEAEYLFHQDPSLDLGHGTLECTKRGMGLTAYCAFRVLGTAWFGAHVDRLLEKAARFAEEIEQKADFELACPPQTNIVCFRYVGDGDTKLGDLDGLQRRIRLDVLASGRYYLVEAQHRGVRWLRVTLMNPRTEEEDLRGLLELVREVAKSPRPR